MLGSGTNRISPKSPSSLACLLPTSRNSAGPSLPCAETDSSTRWASRGTSPGVYPCKILPQGEGSKPGLPCTLRTLVAPHPSRDKSDPLSSPQNTAFLFCSVPSRQQFCHRGLGSLLQRCKDGVSFSSTLGQDGFCHLKQQFELRGWIPIQSLLLTCPMIWPNH